MPMGDLAAQDDYTTPLSADDIPDFQKWKQQYAPRDSGFDYDLPGAYKAGLTPDTATGHWDDQFKKPNHPTFSTFSQYAKDRPDLAGTWQGDQYIPPPARSNLSPDETLMQPPRAALDLPPEAYASLGGGDLGLLGSKGVAGLFGVPSWLQKAQDLGAKDIANYQSGGVPAMMGSLADTSDAQDLAGGFGGNIKGVKASVVPGALAALGDYHPPFYSAVERAVQDAKQNVAPGQQWAGFLRNQPGVKPEEVETLGLGKLFEQPTVSKDALLGEIAANKVNVGEVVKGENFKHPEMQRLEAENNRLAAEYNSLDLPDLRAGEIADLMNVNHDRMREIADTIGPTKFSSYTLPGGENYREMLLTLPTADAPKAARMTEIQGLLQERRPGEEAYRAALRDEYKQLADETRDSPTFKSSHFDEPNVLAHVRYNDRVIDGKKTLFVEEVQSDWHQAGKRKGYQEPPREEPTGRWRVTQTNPDGSTVPYEFDTKAEAEAWAPRVREANRQATVEPATRTVESPYGAVPDAPFKTTWPDLAMKRVIREAAEKGYDKVAWTPGSVQADRYDLSKQVNQLDLTHNRDGVGKLGMTLKDGSRQYVDITSKENLADTVGKDVADKLYKQGAENNGIAVLSGLDLKVGGEGMKGFYDQILPAAVNKIVKKAGGRVEQAQLEGRDRGPLQVTGNGPWVVRTSDGTMLRDFNNRELAHAYADEMRATERRQSSPTVHSVTITPQLREMALKKGFPLFTAGGLVAGGAMGDLAKQDEYQ
jgi:hypothetical protein